jgi:hypothetical protein
MYPNGLHAVKIDRDRNFKGTANVRTGRRPPPFYYFTGFDLSCHYESRDVLDEPLHGRHQSAPEHQSQTQCNPFHADIYYIGNLVRQEFMEVRLVSCPRLRN